MDVPSTELFYNILKEGGRAEFDKLANEIAHNINDARKRWEDEQKAEAERQRVINERKSQETKAALAISAHLNDLFGDIWDQSACSDMAKKLISELNGVAAHMNEMGEKVDKVAEKLPVVEEKETPTSKKVVRKGTIDPKDPDAQDLLDIILKVFG